MPDDFSRTQLNRNNDAKKLPVEAYVNLMKCSWLLRVTTPEAGVEGFSDEVRTMIGLLGCVSASHVLKRSNHAGIDGGNHRMLCIGFKNTLTTKWNRQRHRSCLNVATSAFSLTASTGKISVRVW